MITSHGRWERVNFFDDMTRSKGGEVIGQKILQEIYRPNFRFAGRIE